MPFSGGRAQASKWMTKPQAEIPLVIALEQSLRHEHRELGILPSPPQEGLPMNADQSRRLAQGGTLSEKTQDGCSSPVGGHADEIPPNGAHVHRARGRARGACNIGRLVPVLTTHGPTGAKGILARMEAKNDSPLRLSSPPPTGAELPSGWELRRSKLTPETKAEVQKWPENGPLVRNQKFGHEPPDLISP